MRTKAARGIGEAGTTQPEISTAHLTDVAFAVGHGGPLLN